MKHVGLYRDWTVWIFIYIFKLWLWDKTGCTAHVIVNLRIIPSVILKHDLIDSWMHSYCELLYIVHTIGSHNWVLLLHYSSLNRWQVATVLDEIPRPLYRFLVNTPPGSIRILGTSGKEVLQGRDGRMRAHSFILVDIWYIQSCVSGLGFEYVIILNIKCFIYLVYKWILEKVLTMQVW